MGRKKQMVAHMIANREAKERATLDKRREQEEQAKKEITPEEHAERMKKLREMGLIK